MIEQARSIYQYNHDLKVGSKKGSFGRVFVETVFYKQIGNRHETGIQKSYAFRAYK